MEAEIGVEPVGEAAQAQHLDAGAQGLNLARGVGQRRRGRGGADPVPDVVRRARGAARGGLADGVAMGRLRPERGGGHDLARPSDVQRQGAAIGERAAQRDAALAHEEQMPHRVAAMEKDRACVQHALGGVLEHGGPRIGHDRDHVRRRRDVQ